MSLLGCILRHEDGKLEENALYLQTATVIVQGPSPVPFFSFLTGLQSADEGGAESGVPDAGQKFL